MMNKKVFYPLLLLAAGLGLAVFIGVNERRSLGNLEAMRIRTSDGTEVPFSSVAKATLARGYTTIRRGVTFTADVSRHLHHPVSRAQPLHGARGHPAAHREKK